MKRIKDYDVTRQRVVRHGIVGTEDEIDAMLDLVTAAQQTVSAWESGDLAGAVRALSDCLDRLAREIG